MLNFAGTLIISDVLDVQGHVNLPVYSTIAKEAITSPTDGSLVFDSDFETLSSHRAGNWFQYSKFSVQNLTAATTLIYGDYVYADSSGGSFTLTLPTGAGGEGKQIAIVDAGGSFGSNPVTIQCGGGDTFAATGSSSLILSSSNSVSLFFRDSGSGQWYVLSETSTGPAILESTSEYTTNRLNSSGDTVYGKVFEGVVLGDNTDITVPHGVLGLIRFESILGIARNGTAEVMLPTGAGTGTTPSSLALSRQGSDIVVGCGSNWSGYTATLYIEYTRA